jgi:ABC-type lipoprotein release transport system permease subunit
MLEFVHIALRDIRHYRARSMLCMAGVALIVAVFVTLSATAAGMANMASSAEGPTRSLALVDKGVVDYCQGQIPPAVVNQLRRWPGISDVVPVFHTPVQVDGKMTFVRGVPAESYLQVQNVEILSGGGLERADQVIVGQQLARLNGWDVGDEIEMMDHALEINGIFRGDGFLNTEMWVTLEDGERVLGRDRFYSLVGLRVPSPEDVEKVRSRLRRSSYLARRVDVSTEQELNNKMNQWFSQIEEAMVAVSSLALVAIVFGIFNVVSMTVAERRRAIGILKAIGLSRREITGIYLTQGLVQAGVGYLLGMLLGAVTVATMSRASTLTLVGIPLAPRFSLQTMGLSAGLTVLLSLLGAYLPARRAAVLPVVEALQEM